MTLSPDRARRIGCSDIATILGLRPFGRSPWDVYARVKLGIDEQRDNEAMAAGREFEPNVIRAARESLGLGARGSIRDVTYTHPSLPWFVGTPDDLVTGGDVVEGIEAKVSRKPEEWGEPATIDAWTDEHVGRVPAHYALQVYGYLAITGASAWHLAVRFNDHARTLSPVQVYTFLPDEETQAAIVAALTAWHACYIVGDEEPPLDGSDACTAALARRFPGDAAKLSRAATDDEVGLLIRHAQLGRQIKALESERDTTGNLIRAALGDGWKLYAPAISATLSLASETRRVAGLSELAAHPEILSALDAAGLIRATTSTRTLTVRTPKE